MLIQRATLDSKLMSSVCDVRFARKTPKPGFPPTRRMLCTKSYDLLNSINGKISLNYRPPAGNKTVNEAIHNILTVWDILMQDYRCINASSVDLIQEIPANDDFWDYFNTNIYPMSPDQKMNYMNT